MRVDTGLGDRQPDDAPVALTIGTFDGVHRGHAALIGRTQAVAAERGAESAVLTFDPHPRCVLDPEHCPRSLTTLPEKESVLARLGVHRVTVLPFTREVSAWPAERFCEMLREAYPLRALVVGYDFALGHRRQGDVAFLRDYFDHHEVEVVQVQPLLEGGSPVSSTRVRTAIEDGDVRTAAALLGRHHFLDALVEPGQERGRLLGFPTANLSLAPQKCLPATGVYAMWVRVAGVWHPAATNVGYRPTFGGEQLTVEAYLLDFEGDLYGASVRAAFVERLREERTYATVPALVEQIRRDVEDVRALLGQEAPPRE